MVFDDLSEVACYAAHELDNLRLGLSRALPSAEPLEYTRRLTDWLADCYDAHVFDGCLLVQQALKSERFITDTSDTTVMALKHDILRVVGLFYGLIRHSESFQRDSPEMARRLCHLCIAISTEASAYESQNCRRRGHRVPALSRQDQPNPS